MLSYVIFRDQKNILQKFMRDLDSALMGFAPELASNIPDFLTEEKTLEIFEKLNKIERGSLREYLDVALEKDPSFWSNRQSVTRFFCAARVNLRFCEEK
mgnify:CR=1 FL=1